MRKWFDKLNIYFKCSVLSAIFLFISIIVIIPAHFYNFLEYPFGYLIGISYAIVIHLVIGILENKFDKSYRWAIILIVLRGTLFAVLLVLLGLCYYKWEIRLFNLFTVTSGYVTSLIISLILFLKGNKR